MSPGPDGEFERERSGLDLVQIAAGALAAITAAVVGSRLGVNGTIVGAAVGSIVGTVGSAAYGQFLARTAGRVRLVAGRVPRSPLVRTQTSPGAGTPASDADFRARDCRPPGPGREPSRSGFAVRSGAQPALPWRNSGRRLAFAAATTFLLALGALTAFELLTGEPVSSLTGGGADDEGTTIGEVLGPAPEDPHQTREPAQSTTPNPSPAPTTTAPTASETPTASPTTTTTTTTSRPGGG